MKSAATIAIKQPSRRRSADEWQTLSDQYDQGHLTRNQFCQQYQLTLSTFDYWRCKLRKAKVPTFRDSPVFVELSEHQDRADTVTDQKLNSPAWAIELQLGSQIILRLRDLC